MDTADNYSSNANHQWYPGFTWVFLMLKIWYSFCQSRGPYYGTK